MQVNIEHSEFEKGLLKKTTYYKIDLTIQFSEEEKQIIKERDLAKTLTIMERDVPAHEKPSKYAGIEDLCDLRLARLLNDTDSYVVATPLEAKQYDPALKEKLVALKEYIEENREVEEKSSSFEL